MAKPLTYECLKSVLLYLNANLRFHLFNRCASLKLTEKIVPLRIDSLKLDQRLITVNKTTYLFGIYRDYHTKCDIPRCIQHKNNTGGLGNDLDQYGLPDYSIDHVVTSGDLVIKENGWQEHIDQTRNRSMQQLEENVESSKGSSEKHDEWSLEFYLAELQPHYYKRDNVSPPYDPFIQLTIKHEDETKTIHRTKYTMKLHEAIKKFNTLLFGGRRSTIHVKRLKVSNHHLIIRLPIDVKFRIQELKFTGTVEIAYGELKKVVVNIDEPLEELFVDTIADLPQNFEHSLIANSKSLIIRKYAQRLIGDYLKLKNRRVHMRFEDCLFYERDHILLIRNWLETNRDVGYCYTFAFDKKETVVRRLELIKTEFDGDMNDQG
ncbi:hypothetical protein GCK72_000221 [Caenorhabditis remanei]|uniref:F-box domain-containing protein n=1 Tax=Caenorhabditis remanei TaxID=31234 RepID=A0A6A5HLJ0_CAERE|nr:hypothetical protein GCK72_000221 [Caenorhabditis remanei]KAF1768409.1 hypothetical protein GCK72_000221 [Caenorhabditis remanei]